MTSIFPNLLQFLAFSILGPRPLPTSLIVVTYIRQCLVLHAVIVGVIVKHKSDDPSAWSKILTYISYSRHQIRRILIDNGTVLFSSSFKNICRSAGIIIERTVT